MGRNELCSLIARLTAQITGPPLARVLADRRNREHPAGSALFAEVFGACGSALTDAGGYVHVVPPADSDAQPATAA